MSFPLAQFSSRRKILWHLVALGFILPLCALALQPLLETLDWGLVRLAWRDISGLQWVLAVLASAASFAALGRYDVIIHRVLCTGVPARAAQLSGAAALALSQTLGFGLITGTLARWRGLPAQSILAAGSVTALVSFSFLGAWLMLFAIAGLLSPSSLPLPPIVFKASLFSALCFVLYTALKRYLTLAGRRLRLPSMRAIFALVFYALLDTAFAAFVLWVLLPPASTIGFIAFFPIYLACLGAALLSNAPGGLGPFEVTLLWAMQGQDVNGLLAALIAFRMVYFALPACMAMLYLANPMRSAAEKGPAIYRARAFHAETHAALQTGAPLLSQTGDMIGPMARTSQTTTLLFEPALNARESAKALKKRADQSATIPLFYKCSAQCALALKREGFAVSRIARDAVMTLSEIDLHIPARRSLRRKLRTARKAGIYIAPFELNQENIAIAATIDQEWQANNGAARGFSMGRFAAGYLQQQAVFAAYQGADIVAFISCHTGRTAWALDLMRARADAPSGTMHALVWHAIECAKAEQCATFSLASATCADAPLIRLIDRLSFRRSPKTAGLEQFKRSFAPHWRPLYAAAPNPIALCLALWDVWQEVQDPPPLRLECSAQHSL